MPTGIAIEATNMALWIVVYAFIVRLLYPIERECTGKSDDMGTGRIRDESGTNPAFWGPS
jgi:hypothetical protein